MDKTQDYPRWEDLDEPLAKATKEAQARLLAAGIPICYVPSGVELPPDQVVYEYPDGSRQIVEVATGKVIGPYYGTS